jgi:multiple sugar transport system substrate-binding protein
MKVLNGPRGYFFFLIIILSIAYLLYGVGCKTSEQPAHQVLDLRAHAGTVLRVADLSRGISNAIRPFLSEFYAATGITVILEQNTFDSLRSKLLLELSSESGYFDIVYLSPGYLGEFIEAGFLLPLNQLMSSHKFISSNYLPASIKISQYHKDNNIWGYPYVADTTVLMYRKDLFLDSSEQRNFMTKYGYPLPIPTLETPLTTQQFLDLAQHFTRPGQMYGYGYPQVGAAYGNLYIMPWLWTFGAEYYDAVTNRSQINSPAALQGLNYALDLQAYQPNQVTSWEYGEQMPTFYAGQLAMTAGWFDQALAANDPKQSAIAGKVGYALMPQFAANSAPVERTVLGGGSLAITRHSANVQAAYLFLDWMFGNPERALAWFLQGGAAVMPSVYASPRVLERYPWAEEFFPVARAALVSTAKQRPVHRQAHRMFELVSRAWHGILSGAEQPELALRRLQRDIDAILLEQN